MISAPLCCFLNISFFSKLFCSIFLFFTILILSAFGLLFDYLSRPVLQTSLGCLNLPRPLFNSEWTEQIGQRAVRAQQQRLSFGGAKERFKYLNIMSLGGMLALLRLCCVINCLDPSSLRRQIVCSTLFPWQKICRQNVNCQNRRRQLKWWVRGRESAGVRAELGKTKGRAEGEGRTRWGVLVC